MFRSLSYLFIWPSILGLGFAAFTYWGPSEKLGGTIVVALPSVLFCWIGLKFDEKAKVVNTGAVSAGISKSGLFGATVCTAAAVKANCISKPPVVIARGNHGGQAHGVNHVGGKKYEIYGSYAQQNNRKKFRKIVEPGISGFNEGPADFDMRW